MKNCTKVFTAGNASIGASFNSRVFAKWTKMPPPFTKIYFTLGIGPKEWMPSFYRGEGK